MYTIQVINLSTQQHKYYYADTAAQAYHIKHILEEQWDDREVSIFLTSTNN